MNVHIPRIPSIKHMGQFAAVLLFALVAPLFLLTHIAHAQDWNAGDIIDDYTFTNAWTLSPGQIQAFLNSKVTSCDTNGTQTATDFGSTLTHAQYAASQGWPGPPYTCLKDYTENGLSSAQIIYNLAQQYQINPEVLIVLLQKEQGLVTDTWPLSTQYRTATGYGCPDTAPCDSQYYGLTNQLTWSAKMFRAIMNASPTWYTPYVLGNNYIAYNPVSSCGGSTVNIQNRATQALYNYTPYQPNAAAIAAPMGATVSCGAYGNLNFLRYFNSWFGNTYNVGYAATWLGQSANPTLNPGDSYTGSITYQNSGSVPWYDNTSTPIHIATDQPINRASDFAPTDGSWGSGNNRPSLQFSTVYDTSGNAYASNPHVVQPGESVKFTYTITVPQNYPAGSYSEYIRPIVEGGSYMPMSPPLNWITITVNQINKAAYVGQSGYVSLLGGQQKTNFIDFKNTGNFTWYDNTTAGQNNAAPVRLASVDSTGQNNASSVLGDSSWGSGQNRPTGVFAAVFDKNGSQYSTNPHAVQPGETARFVYTLTAPDNASPSTIRTYFAPVADGGAGIAAVSSSTGVPTSVWSDTTIVASPSLRPLQPTAAATINPLTRSSITYQFKNTGSTTLTQATTTLNVISGDASMFADNTWPGNPVIGQLDQASVAPGATGTFTVYFSAPLQSGSYNFSVTPFVSGSQAGLSAIQTTLAVPQPVYSAGYAGQSGYPTIQQGANAQSFIQYQNTGNVPWYDGAVASGNIKPVDLATTNPINRSDVFSGAFPGGNRPTTSFSAVYESDGVTLAPNQHIAQPGEIARFSFTLTAPQQVNPGTYREYFQPILEGGNPWNMGGVAWSDVTVTGASFSATWVGQTAFPTIARGSSAQTAFYYRNSGSATWYDASSIPQGLNPITFATVNPINRTSSFLPTNRPAVTFAAVYQSDGVTLAPNQHIAQPGQIVKFSFTLTVPSSLSTGTYREYFQPILEGGNPWNMGAFSWTDITVS